MVFTHPKVSGQFFLYFCRYLIKGAKSKVSNYLLVDSAECFMEVQVKRGNERRYFISFCKVKITGLPMISNERTVNIAFFL